MMTANRFTSFRIHNDNAGYRSGISQMSVEQLTPGDTVIQVHYSSVNYKDALAATGKGKILRQFPLNGGIDCSGIVISSENDSLKRGDPVLVTGSGLSETADGGYSNYVRTDSMHCIPLPANWSLRDAMVMGTAGFTAGLALHRMLENHQKPALGPIAITGATGGVGILGTALFSLAGFRVHAISGKPEYRQTLEKLGAECVLPRDAVLSDKAMDSVRFGGALDGVGGHMLSGLLAQTAPCGNVASYGLVSSPSLQASVMPFIIRGVSLLGIASAGTERSVRERVWQLLAQHFSSDIIKSIPVRDIAMNDLPEAFNQLLSGAAFGRYVVKINDGSC